MDEQEKRHASHSSQSAHSDRRNVGKSHSGQIPVKDDGEPKVESASLEETKKELEYANSQAAANMDGWQRERANLQITNTASNANNHNSANTSPER